MTKYHCGHCNNDIPEGQTRCSCWPSEEEERIQNALAVYNALNKSDFTLEETRRNYETNKTSSQ